MDSFQSNGRKNVRKWISERTGNWELEAIIEVPVTGLGRIEREHQNQGSLSQGSSTVFSAAPRSSLTPAPFYLTG